MNSNNSKMECGNGAKDMVSASLVSSISTEKRLAKEHWEYVKNVLLTSGVGEEEVTRIGFHYKTAFCHGFKHAKEEMKGRYKPYGGGSYPPSIMSTLYK